MNTTTTITITFGDVAENHVGMQKIGTMSDKGFELSDLKDIRRLFPDCKTELIDLRETCFSTEEIKRGDIQPAHVLIIRNGVEALLDNNGYVVDQLYEELLGVEWDTKAKMYGRVVNKKARYNVCFDDEGQEPNYEEGKGRIVSYADVPILNCVRDQLEIVGQSNLKAEGNLYYDSKKCGIGWHGDAERRKVIALRLGATIPICYRWYHKSKPVSDKVCKDIYHGDIYVMSDKAVGNDWKKKNIYTLRHSAGSEKYTN